MPDSPKQKTDGTAGETVRVNGGESVDLVTGNAPGAPHLRYDLPASTEFEYVVFIPLNVALDKFRPVPADGQATQETPSYRVPVTGPVTADPHLPSIVTKSPLLVDPKEPIWNPGDFVTDFLAMPSLSNERVAMARKIGLEGRNSGDTLDAGAAVASRRSLSHIVYQASAVTYQATLRKNFYGDVQPIYVSNGAKKRQRLFIAERYRVASYLGDFGATSVVSTVTLLPGEKTTITLSQSVNDTEQRSITTNILDSYNSQSAQEFEGQVNDQRTLGFSQTDQAGGQETTTDATQMSASLSVSGGVNLGIAKIGGSASGSIAHQTSDTNTTTHNHTRQDSAQTVSSALDRHVDQTSSARSYQSSTGTQQQSTVTTSESNVTVREIENINRSRVLNFVIRQLSQEYHTVTYLHDAQFVYIGPDVSDTAVATLGSLNELLNLVLVDDKVVAGKITASARREVLAQIVHSLSNVSDVSNRPISLIERFAPQQNSALLDAAGLTTYLHTKDDGLPRFVRNRRSVLEKAQQGDDNPLPKLGDRGGPITVDGIVVDVRRRMLKTNALVADALLGQSAALDGYNLRLQDAAAEKQELANQQLSTALDIVTETSSIQDRAAVYSQVFNNRDVEAKK